MEGDGMQQPSSRQLFNVTAIAEQSVYLNPGKTAWKTKFEWRHGNYDAFLCFNHLVLTKRLLCILHE